MKGLLVDAILHSGLVQQNKAKNELAQRLAEDPLPLRGLGFTLGSGAEEG